MQRIFSKIVIYIEVWSGLEKSVIYTPPSLTGEMIFFFFFFFWGGGGGGGWRHGVTYGLNMYFCTSVTALTTSMLPQGQIYCVSLNEAVAFRILCP